jgi:hypothetical protein
MKTPALDKILEKDDLVTEEQTSVEEQESNEGQQEIAEAPQVQFTKVPHKIPSPLKLHSKFLIANQVFEVYDVKNKQRYYIKRIGIAKEA